MTTADRVQNIVDSVKTHKDQGNTDFADVYKGILQLQQQDKELAKITADMATLNERLHKLHLLSEVTITGVDNSNHLLGLKDGKEIVVDASKATQFLESKESQLKQLLPKDLHLKDLRPQDLLPKELQSKILQIKDPLPKEPPPKEVPHSWFKSIENVTEEIAKGALDEIVHHPVRVLECAAVGLVVGAASALVAPEVAIVAGIAGGAYAGYELAMHTRGWIHYAKVVANPQNFTSKEVLAADKGMQGFGSGAVDVTAGLLGGISGDYFGTAMKPAVTAEIGSIKSGFAARAAAREAEKKANQDFIFALMDEQRAVLHSSH